MQDVRDCGGRADPSRHLTCAQPHRFAGREPRGGARREERAPGSPSRTRRSRRASLRAGARRRERARAGTRPPEEGRGGTGRGGRTPPTPTSDARRRCRSRRSRRRESGRSGASDEGAAPIELKTPRSRFFSTTSSAMFETMFSAATTMTSATVAKMTAFSSRSANASGAFKSRHVWTRYAGPSRDARAAPPPRRRGEGSVRRASHARAPVGDAREKPRRLPRRPRRRAASRRGCRGGVDTTRTATATGIGPIGERRVREERRRTHAPPLDPAARRDRGRDARGRIALRAGSRQARPAERCGSARASSCGSPRSSASHVPRSPARPRRRPGARRARGARASASASRSPRSGETTTCGVRSAICARIRS